MRHHLLLALAALAPPRVASKPDCYVEDFQDPKTLQLRWSAAPGCINLFLQRVPKPGVQDEDVLGLVDELKAASDKVTKLETIDLSGNSVSAKGAAALAGWVNLSTKLRAIELRDNRLGDEGAAELGYALGNSMTLETLGLMQTEVGDEGAIGLASGLRRSTSLTELALSFNYVGATGGKALADAIVGNKQLRLSAFAMERNMGDEPVDANDLDRIREALVRPRPRTPPPKPELSAAQRAAEMVYPAMDEL